MRTIQGGSNRRGSRLAGAAVAGFLGLLVIAPWGAPAAEEPITDVTLERMAYVVDGPSDPYASDPATVHVGVTGGEEFARSFVRLGFDLLPPKALLGNVTMTLRITQSAEASGNTVYQTYNVNASSALLQACVLTSELPATFDKANPPEYDCAHGSAVGVRGTGDAWNFDLAPLVKAWSKAGNTGAAIIPIASGPADTWAVSFFKARSSYDFSYTVPPAPPPKPSPGKLKPAYYPIPRNVPAPYPFPTAVPTVAPPAVTAPIPQAPTAVTVPGVRSKAWTWVLPVCLAIALVMLALSQRQALAAVGGRLAALRTNLRLRPRAHTIAAVVGVWGLLFASYSVVVTPPPRLISSGGGPVSENPLGGGPSNNGVPGVTTPTSGPGAPTVAPGTSSPVPGGRGGGGAKPAGRYERIGGINVFFPADGSAPVAQLYSGADDLIGLDFARKVVKLCGHAAMTYGPAFDVDEADLGVFFQWLNDRGGVNGWKFEMDLIDDGYDPGKAVQAAQTCKDSGAFMLLGGIGFDQIPAVRQWAEQNHELYAHHVVTKAGSRGLKYSFTPLPSEEQLGIWAGQLAVQKFRGKKVGILYRQSPNWQSGHDLFLSTIRGKLTVVGDRPVQKNQGNYTQDVAALRDADVIFAWENALGTAEMIKAAQAQQLHPAWIVFPFNLELRTLRETALDQPLFGIAAWDAYDASYHGGPYSPYAKEIEEFEAAYRQYDPSANLNGFGGDLLFLTWEGYKGLADLFRACGPNCTRNRMAAALLTYNRKLGGLCRTDFTRGDRHHGGWVGNTLEVYNGPGGPAWKPLQRCMGSF
jgi:substrate-binding family protein